VKEFEPHWGLRNGHLMTIAGVFWRRRFPRLPPSVPRLFDTEPRTQLRGDCHWQQTPREHSTLVLLHGLEGSSQSGYMLGTAEKAWVAGFNVVRLNQRNCGGTEKLTPTVYHSGLSSDMRAVILELIDLDRLPRIFAAGFSMGGNLTLKLAGELGGETPEEIRGFVAVAPCFHLAACCDALRERRNIFYDRHFVRRLKQRMRYKASLFPGIYAKDGLMRDLERVRSVRDFDDKITAPCWGFRDAADYYARESAMNVVAAIRRPALVITAADDPFVPIETFKDAALRGNRNIQVIATRYGGHCAFISRESGDERFWSEGRIVEFCVEQLAKGN
jgi:predicted alpha/beta-fold hydrolase